MSCNNLKLFLNTVVELLKTADSLADDAVSPPDLGGSGMSREEIENFRRKIKDSLWDLGKLLDAIKQTVEVQQVLITIVHLIEDGMDFPALDRKEQDAVLEARRELLEGFEKSVKALSTMSIQSEPTESQIWDILMEAASNGNNALQIYTEYLEPVILKGNLGFRCDGYNIKDRP